MESPNPDFTAAEAADIPHSSPPPVPVLHPPQTDLEIPDGYPTGIYGPKPALRVPEWESFKWAAAERARRQDKGCTPQRKEPQLIAPGQGVSGKHLPKQASVIERQSFQWAAAERARRLALNASPQLTYSQELFSEGDSSAEEHVPKQGLKVPHWESLKWAAEERARRQGGQHERERERR